MSSGRPIVNTVETCGSIVYDIAVEQGREPRLLMRANSHAGKSLKAVSETCLRTSCDGALAAAGVSLEQIDFFVENLKN